MAKNALFEEREKNVFVKPDEQNQAYLSFAMAKRVDELASNKTLYPRPWKRRKQKKQLIRGLG